MLIAIIDKILRFLDDIDIYNLSLVNKSLTAILKEKYKDIFLNRRAKRYKITDNMQHVKRGDIIVNGNNNYIWNGKQLVEIRNIIPKDFIVPNEFPPKYWNSNNFNPSIYINVSKFKDQILKNYKVISGKIISSFEYRGISYNIVFNQKKSSNIKSKLSLWVNQEIQRLATYSLSDMVLIASLG